MTVRIGWAAIMARGGPAAAAFRTPLVAPWAVFRIAPSAENRP
ncbi:hypothetical protein [Streptomyces altiplanensis]